MKNKEKIHYLDEMEKDGWCGNWFSPENYPEFWEEVVEKDYEILSLIEGKFIYPCDKYSKDYINQLFNTLGVSIHSVKRNDGEIFTIGDNTKYGCIDKFYIKNNYLLATTVLESNGRYLKDLEKLKQKLFTTEDGVDIFKGDLVVCFDKDSFCIRNQTYLFKEYDKNDRTYLFFSTKEKAEEYILMNKPCLSLNEIFKDVEEMRKGLKTFENSQLAKRFKKLVKQKLNNKN